MAPKHTLPAPRPELAEAVDTANAALAERARLIELRPTITADLVAAQQQRDDAATAVKAATLDVVLSGDPPTPELVGKADAAQAALTVAENRVTRLAHALDGLPGKLEAAETAMLVAEDALRPLLAERVGEGVAEFEAEVRQAVQALLPLALRWKARAVALGVPSAFLTDLRIPGITSPMPILSGLTTQNERGQALGLDEVWRDDPAALATYHALAPATATGIALSMETGRIRDARRAAEIEGARTMPPQRQQWRADPPAPPPTGPRFTPNSYDHSTTIAPPYIPSDHVHGAAPGAPPGFRPSAGVRFPDAPHPHGGGA